MKAYNTVAALLASALLLCGCFGNAEENSDVSAAQKSESSYSDSSTDEVGDLCALAQSLSVNMAEGDFSETVKLFSPALSEQLDENSLKTAWKSTTSAIGEFAEFSEVSEEQSGGNTVVTAVLRYEKSGLKVSITFNSDGKIDGIWLNYCVLPESGETYTEQAIKIGQYELDGLLTLPNDMENPPVVILVQGSGQTDMNETIGANVPFEDIAYGLVDNGIAVIRYNKRYYQYPELANDEITVRDEVTEDVSAAVEYAKTVCGEDGKIIIAGHSLGGMLAPEICAENPDVDGMVSLAGSPRQLADIIYDQNEAALKSAELTGDEISAQLEMLKEETEKIKSLSENDTGEYLGVNARYWKSLNEINTAETAKSLDIPMLFLQGGEDFQVYADKDFALWKEYLSGRDNCTFKLYDGLNHLFMISNGKADSSEYDVKGSVSSEVTDDISEWINNI